MSFSQPHVSQHPSSFVASRPFFSGASERNFHQASSQNSIECTYVRFVDSHDGLKNNSMEWFLFQIRSSPQSQAATGRPHLLQTLFTVTLIQVWIIPTFRHSHLILLPDKTMYGYPGVTKVPVSLLCRSLIMTKLADYAASKACGPVHPHLMQ